MSLRSRFCIHGLNRKLTRAAHVMGPTLIALALAGATNVAHAQGTMDFSGAQMLMSTFKSFSVPNTLLKKLVSEYMATSVYDLTQSGANLTRQQSRPPRRRNATPRSKV